MKSPKKFDCVEIKRTAQERVLEKIQGMTWEQERDYFHRSIQSSPLGAKWARIRARQEKKKAG